MVSTPLTFILDVHLGTLARKLRMLGFNCLYDNSYDDSEIIDIALDEDRIILTRDRGISENRTVMNCYLVQSTDPDEQVKEVLKEFHLFLQIEPFLRCMECNGLLRKVKKEDVADKLPGGTKEDYDEFDKCMNCGKVYWEGSHYDSMKEYIKSLSPD